MSLLGQENSQALDDAARGESFTKGTSHVAWAGIAAAVIVTVAIVIYVVAGQKKPVATGEVSAVWAHPMHTVTPAFDAGGAPMAQDAFDQVLVFTTIRLHNQSKGPIFLHQIVTNVALADGVHSSYAAEASQYDRIFLAYPDLAPWHTSSLSPELSLQAGQSIEGTFVSALKISKDQWESRKGLNYTFSFRYQPDVTVTPTVSVTEH